MKQLKQKSIMVVKQYAKINLTMFCCLHIFVNIILVFVEVKKNDFCVVVSSFLSRGTLVGLCLSFVACSSKTCWPPILMDRAAHIASTTALDILLET